MKYLKLTFKNAGFFIINNGTKDFVFDINGQRKRKDAFMSKQQKVSISVNQISNMLHVLMGERPSATYRETYIKSIPYIFEVAQNSYIKIDNPRFSFVDKKTQDTKFYYQSETITTRKSVWNSFSKTKDLVYWKRIENALTDDDNSKYIEMISLFSEILGYNVLTKPAEEVVEELRLKHPYNQKINDFKSSLKGKTPIIKFIDGDYWANGTGNGDLNKNSRTLITTNNGIEKIIRLSGSIIIPLNDNDIEKIRNSKSTATLLDGGVVWVEDLIDENDFGIIELIEYVNINKLEEYENKI